MNTEKSFRVILLAGLTILIGLSGVVLGFSKVLNKAHEEIVMPEEKLEGIPVEAKVACVPIRATITVNDKTQERTFTRCFLLVDTKISLVDTSIPADTTAVDSTPTASNNDKN